MPDFFGLLDRVRTLIPPEGYEAIHANGYSWARTGSVYADTSRVSAEEWNQLIGNFRALLTIPNVVFDDTNPRSPYLLRDVIVSFSSKKIAELLPSAIVGGLADFMVGRSTTSVAIGTGSKAFPLVSPQPGWDVGMRAHAAERTDPSGRWMEGWITGISETDVTILVDDCSGAGTFSDWSISLSWEPLSPSERAKLGFLTVAAATDLDAIRTRVQALDAAVILKGVWSAAGGSFPGAGAAQAGESWIVSVAGSVDGVSFAVGDRIIAILDNASASTFASNWFKADYTDAVSSVVGLTGAITAGGLKTALAMAYSDLTGTIPDAGLPTRLREIAASVADWNTATANGFYMGATGVNSPEGVSDWCYGWVVNHGGAGYCHQILIGFTGVSAGRWYMRKQTAGAWGSWTRLYLTAATETVPGAVQLTTDAAVATGTATDRGAVSPAQLKTAAQTHTPATKASFRAQPAANQTGIAPTTATKIQVTDEDFDVGGFYDAANAKWTPPAGIVCLGGEAFFSAGVVDQQWLELTYYKNGVELIKISRQSSGTQQQGVGAPIISQCNGTDYYEVYCLAGGAGNKTLDAARTYFWGHMI